MKRTRLYERLPKRDRDEVLRINALQISWAPSPEAYALNELRLLRDHLRKLHGRRTPSSLLAWCLHGLKSYFCDRAIIRRLLDDDVSQLSVGVNTAARLGLLMSTAGGSEYSSYDCAHVFDLLLALAVDDETLVQAFLSRFPSPFRSGHPATVLLSNGLYAVLSEDRTTFAILEPSIRAKSERHFFRAMFDCLLAIMSDDTNLMAGSITKMVKWNRRQDQLNSSMQKLICLYAHAFFNICRRVFIPRGISLPVIPNESTWDAGFQELIQSSEGGHGFFDFSPVNPLLARWMNDLPAALAAEELVAHLS